MNFKKWILKQHKKIFKLQSKIRNIEKKVEKKCKKHNKLLSKTFIVGVILLAVCYSSFSQEFDTVSIDTNVNKICLERGHVKGGIVMTTDMYCPPYLVENDSISYMVYPACNYESFTCKRCGKHVSQLEKERRVVLWRKEK